jgi:hypothetical protein
VTGRPDPLQLPETAGGPLGRQLTPGEKVGLFAVMFFATCGVIVFALTLPHGTQVAIGVGWGMIIREVMAWADQLGKAKPDA